MLFKKNRWEEEDREERKRALEAYAEERGVEVEELIREAEAQDIEWEGDTGENSKGKGKEQEEEWGMKVMLKALGIAEDMLGWDQETGSWKD